MAAGIVLALAGTTAGGAAGVATQDEVEGPGMAVLLDAVDPVVVQPGEPVTLRGRVVNDAPDTVRVPSLTVTASTVPLASRTEVRSWLDGEVPRDTTWLLGEDSIGPVGPAGGEVEFSVTVPADITDDLPVGPSALAVALTAGVEGGAAGDPSATDGAELRSVLTSTGDAEVDQPLQVSWVVPLTLPADVDLVSPDPEAHAAAWTAAIGPGSTLRGWLDHLTVPEVTYVVDPATLVAPRPAPGVAVPEPEPVEQPGEPEPTGPATEEPTSAPAPEVGTTSATGQTEAATATQAPSPAAATEAPLRQPDGPGVEDEADVTEREPDDTDVEEALTGLRSALLRLAPHQLWWLPTDDPDLTSILAASPPRTLVTDLLDRPPVPEELTPVAVTRLLQTGRSDVAWPVRAAPTTQDVTRVARLYADRDSGDDPLAAVVVPREAMTADSSARPRRGAAPLTEPDGVLALGADSWTTALVAASRDDAEAHGPGAATQRLLAHTMGTYLEAPGSARELVIAPPRGGPASGPVLDQLSQGWREASWLESVAAGELLERAEDTDPLALTGIPPQPDVLGELTPYLITPPSPVGTTRAPQLVDLHRDFEALREVLADTDALRSWRPVLAGLWSTRWRQDPLGWRGVWQTLREDVRSSREAIHVTPSSVNFLTNQGSMQVTVVNDLAVAVEDVHLVLQPDNPGLLQVVRQPDPVSIGAGSRASVPFEARAITRGETTLTARVASPSGVELGPPAEVAVLVQPPGVWIYWVLGGLAGLILVLGLWRALRGAPRRVARPGPGRTDAPKESTA